MNTNFLSFANLQKQFYYITIIYNKGGVLSNNERNVIKRLTEENGLDYDSIIKDAENQISNFDTNNQKIILACNKGLTSYLASRELFNLPQTTQLNTNNIYSLVGGYSLYLLYQN